MNTIGFFLKDAGEPIEIVYAPEGVPLVPGQAGVLKDAPHPNAARLFANFLFSQECQQLMGRRRRPALVPSQGHPQARPQAAQRHQGPECRSHHALQKTPRP